jgi:Bifunctional DNA primase/polymerase, N-terminal
MIDLSDLRRFPCGEDKSPRTWWGKKAQPYERWYGMYDERWQLVGVETGGVNGFDVLDVDPDGLEWFRANQHRLPETRAHVTRRRGLHLFFHAWPTLRCSVGRIAPGVDVRAEGGYVIWWPREGAPVANPDLLAEMAGLANRPGA